MSKKGIYIAKLDQIKAEYKVFGNKTVYEHLKQYPDIKPTTRHVIEHYIYCSKLSVSWDKTEVIKDLTDITK